MAHTTNTMSWDNLYNTFIFLQRKDAATADAKIVDYLNDEVQKAVADGFSTEDALKKRLRLNLVSDKKCRINKDIKNATGDKRAELENKMHLVNLFDEYTRREGADTRTQYHATNATTSVKLTKSKWQFTKAELMELEGDSYFWTSIYNNIKSVQSKTPERMESFFGSNWFDIINDAADYARLRARGVRPADTAPAAPKVEMTLEEKIAKGIPVVITPEVIAKLAKLYPNAGIAAADAKFTVEDAEALEAEKKAKEEEKARIAAEEAKARAEARAERERLEAEKKEKARIAAEEAAAKAAKRAMIEEALKAKLAEKKAVVNEEPTEIPVDCWAEEVDKENAKPEIIIPEPSPEMIVWQRANDLKEAIKATGEDMIHGYELDVDWSVDIDVALAEIVKQYPDNFEYDEETDEIWFFPDEG